MNEQQAKELIKDVFDSPFDREKYTNFLAHFLNDFEKRDRHYSGNLIPEAYRKHIRQYWRVGKYVDPEGEEIDLLVVEVKSFSKLEKARSALRNFAVNRLDKFKKDASLIAFFASDDRGEDWRFSFVKTEYTAELDEKGKVKTKKKFTPAKRYSYLVGVHEHSHTAIQQLLPILRRQSDANIEEIENAFSVEKVTDEFFKQYEMLFENLSSFIDDKDIFQNREGSRRFAEKLLSQIVFLFFLQKKKWLGVPKGKKWGEGQKDFMTARFETITQNGEEYYRDFLQHLFYEALAKERQGEDEPGYYERFDCKIPFLNGGLFEAEFDWKDLEIIIPNELFRNDQRTDGGDVGTGILDVFNRYNFTIKEDEPLEKEVALDPEMLGKVFEKLFASRKELGAIYTPREIVHYMCQESLAHYLDWELNSYSETNKHSLEKIEDTKIVVSREDLTAFIKRGIFSLEDESFVRDKGKPSKATGIPKSIRENAHQIDAALQSIKICDPAIGSGAFPVGMLHEIVNARLALSPYLDSSATPYDLKRHAIQKSLYGVDIDSSAVEIARLRLWLSLIVDEDDYKEEKALPNLDYKVMVGNSLIGATSDIINNEHQKKLEGYKSEYFDTSNIRTKRKLRKKINGAIRAILDSLSEWAGFEIDFDFTHIFSEVWSENDGFDIVIGNPPYRSISKYSEELKQKWAYQNYTTFAKSGNIYGLFYEKGFRLAKPGGVVAMITQNSWMKTKYGAKLRSFFGVRTQPLVLIDFSDFVVFDSATTNTNILVFRKQNRSRGVRACLIDRKYDRVLSLGKFISLNSIEFGELSNSSWTILDKRELVIKNQIEKKGVPLRDWDISINYGIKTGFLKAFIIREEDKTKLILEDPKSTEILKPVLQGKHIKRYNFSFQKEWLITSHNGYTASNGAAIEAIDIQTYPAVKKYLEHIELLRDSGRLGKKLKKNKGLFKRSDQGRTPYNLRSCSYIEAFEGEKIGWGNLAQSCQFSLIPKGLYIHSPSPFINSGDRYLLGALNSEVADYYIRSLGVTRSGGYFEYLSMYISPVPIPKPEDDVRGTICMVVNFVIFIKVEIYRAFFEQLIDGLVYELYFPEEIKAAGKEIFEHVGELTPLTDQMSEEEKLAIIKKEFDRLYDPSHPVRNHLETLDSVEVVRIIRDALKK